MKIAKYITILFIGLTLNSCYLFDSDADEIIGKYEVLWIDTPNTRAVCERYSSTGSSVLISEYVFAVGHNSDFIIAKQHPTNGFRNGYKVDTNVTNYFVIDINGKDTKDDYKVIGPLSKNEFEKTIISLKIETIEFDQFYPENPN